MRPGGRGGAVLLIGASVHVCAIIHCQSLVCTPARCSDSVVVHACRPADCCHALPCCSHAAAAAAKAHQSAHARRRSQAATKGAADCLASPMPQQLHRASGPQGRTIIDHQQLSGAGSADCWGCSRWPGGAAADCRLPVVVAGWQEEQAARSSSSWRRGVCCHA